MMSVLAFASAQHWMSNDRASRRRATAMNRRYLPALWVACLASSARADETAWLPVEVRERLKAAGRGDLLQGDLLQGVDLENTVFRSQPPGGKEAEVAG